MILRRIQAALPLLSFCSPSLSFEHVHRVATWHLQRAPILHFACLPKMPQSEAGCDWVINSGICKFRFIFSQDCCVCAVSYIQSQERLLLLPHSFLYSGVVPVLHWPFKVIPIGLHFGLLFSLQMPLPSSTLVNRIVLAELSSTMLTSAQITLPCDRLAFPACSSPF